jgi:hypothetical protein
MATLEHNPPADDVGARILPYTRVDFEPLEAATEPSVAELLQRAMHNAGGSDYSIAVGALAIIATRFEDSYGDGGKARDLAKTYLRLIGNRRAQAVDAEPAGA